MNLDLSDLSTPVLVTLGVVIAFQLTLQVFSLMVLARTESDRLLFGRKWPWVLIILVVNLVGAVAFLAFGRRVSPIDDHLVPNPRGGDSASRTVQSLYGDDQQ